MIVQAQVTADNVSNTTSFIACQKDIVDAIRSFPNGSAGGLDELRPHQHLKDMTSAQCGHVGKQLINNLTVFSNTVLSGKVPDGTRPVSCCANILVLSKKEGGIKPIAVGCT